MFKARYPARRICFTISPFLPHPPLLAKITTARDRVLHLPTNAHQQFQQELVAIIGFACRLPGGNHSLQQRWDFLEQDKVASNKFPVGRFNIDGQHDGSLKPETMQPGAGMFLSDEIDVGDCDASLFEIGGTDAATMNPNERQLLEVVFEGLENAGLNLNGLDDEP